MKCLTMVVGMVFLLPLIAAPVDVPLVDALRDGDRAMVRSLLQQQVDVNTPTADGATALHWAAHLDDLETVQLLIGAGADTSVANRYGVTPLLLACANGNAAIIEVLLKAKADPNTVSPEGESALMMAARTGKVAAVRLLIDHHADVNAKENWREQTALMWAAAEGHLEAVEALIGSGADMQMRSKRGFTPLLIAVRQGQAGVVNALLKAGADVDETLPARKRRSYNSVPSSNASKTKLTGASVLHLAVSNNHFALAATLLEAGADPNASGQGWTPLHNIIGVRKPGVGSNDPAPSGSGNMGSLELVRKLVAHGADVNARVTQRSGLQGSSNLNFVGATPFLMAARTGDPELMRLLNQLGADPFLPNEENTTPLMVAAGVGTRSNTEDAGTATKDQVLEAVKVALELGNDLDAVDDRGETAMHGAAYKNLPAVIDFLNEKGSNIEIWNRNNVNGWTPLRIAVGVHRGMNKRTSPEAATALYQVMQAFGVSTEVEPERVIRGDTR